MRHRVHGRKLGRTSAHRKALFRNQLTALLTHERIITTIAKAKELRPLAERMVTLARNDTLAARRKVATMVADKDVARRLFDEIAPRFADRPGGYTRIMRLGRRHGDNAELAIIEFVDYDLADHQEEGDARSKGSLLDRAKGVFGGGAAKTAAAEPAAGAEETIAPEAEAEQAAAAEPEPVAEPEEAAEAEEQAAAEPEPEPEAAAEPAADEEPADDDEAKDKS